MLDVAGDAVADARFQQMAATPTGNIPMNKKRPGAPTINLTNINTPIFYE
jgi:hypothetical protein